MNFPSRAHRNLCIDGGYEICAEMYNKNILAPLATFIPKVSAQARASPLGTRTHHLSTCQPWFAPRSPRFYHNMSTLRRRRPRMHRKLSTNSLKMSSPYCGASRKFDIAMLRGGSSPTLSTHRLVAFWAVSKIEVQGNVKQGPQCRKQSHARAVLDGFPIVARQSTYHDGNISWYVRRFKSASRAQNSHSPMSLRADG
jgi:hypothetical protein